MARCTWTDIAIAGQTPSAMARSQSLASLLEAHAKLDLLARSEVGQRRLNDFASIAQRFIRAPTELPAQPFAAHRTGAANGGAWLREKLVALIKGAACEGGATAAQLEARFKASAGDQGIGMIRGVLAEMQEEGAIYVGAESRFLPL
jgi:hypothetical protein